MGLSVRVWATGRLSGVVGLSVGVWATGRLSGAVAVLLEAAMLLEAARACHACRHRRNSARTVVSSGSPVKLPAWRPGLFHGFKGSRELMMGMTCASYDRYPRPVTMK
jgi:hypothetical protein